MTTIQKILSESVLFSGLTLDEIKDLEDLAHLKQYQRNEVIFSEGQPAKGLYLIAGGKVKIYKLSTEGREHILHTFNPGDVFAEAAVFSGTTYPAFAETLIDSEIIFILREELLALIKEKPDLGLKMMGTLSSRLRHFVNIIEDLSLKDVSARLAKYILDLSIKTDSSKTITLDINKSELARRIGTVPETLSRTLKKLNQSKILTIESKEIRITNIEKLKKISAGLKI